MARWCSRLARQPVTLEVDGSSPFRVAKERICESGCVLSIFCIQNLLPSEAFRGELLSGGIVIDDDAVLGQGGDI